VAAIGGVMFDYGQTLVTFAFPRDELLEVIRNFLPTIEEALGGPAPPAEALLEDVFLPLEEYVTSTSEDEVDWLDVFKASWDRAGMSLPDGLLYEMADAEQLCWDRIVKVDPDAMHLLSTLRDRGIKRVLCSNAPFPPEMMRRQVATNGIGPLMDAVVFSSMVGKRKPALEMYRAALDAIGLPAERVLFVGNRLKEDYEGPAAAGMSAVIYTAHNAEMPPPGIPTISTLRDLPGLL
jgi:HAD superfamily hydrolase (TIGR01509 family)